MELQRDLRTIIHHTEDQVLFIDPGPATGRGAGAIASLGRAYVYPVRVAVVV